VIDVDFELAARLEQTIKYYMSKYMLIVK